MKNAQTKKYLMVGSFCQKDASNAEMVVFTFTISQKGYLPQSRVLK
jgi:hypothetical protein